MFELATIVECFKIENQNVTGQTLPQKVRIDYLQAGDKRRVVDQPYYKDMRIRQGIQNNEKAEKLMYLYPTDQWLPQNATVVWEFRNKKFSGKVKFTKAKGAIVMGYDKEVYILSDNE